MKSYQKLYEYDLFGYTVGLYFNGNTKEGTLFGLIISLVYILTFIAVIIYYINEMFSRKKYTFSTSTMEQGGIVSIKLDKDIFAFNFGLQDPITYADYIDETIYNIKANLVTGKRDPVTQGFLWYSEEIKTESCSPDMFGRENQKYFKDSYKNKYCLVDIDQKNLTGHFNYDYYNQIIISFYKCINSTENNNHCKPKNIIDYYLNNTYVALFLQSLTIDENRISMLNFTMENHYTTIGQNFFKDYQIFFKIIDTEVDDGVIFKSKKYRRMLQIDYSKDRVAINQKVNDASLCDITIKLSDKKTIYKKSYEKLIDALYKAGGIMPIIYYIIKVCFLLPVKIVYEINVINKIFKFDMSRFITKISDKNIIPNFKSNSLKNSKLNIIKDKNDEDIKDNNKNIANSELVYFKKNRYLVLKKPSVKDIQSDSSVNHIYNKNISNNNLFPENNINQKKCDNNLNNFRENLEKEIKDYNINNQKNDKYIVNTIKINLCKLLCYWPIKHFTNNTEVILIEKGRKIFMESLDVVNVFQNIMRIKKVYDNILKNKGVFDLSDNNINISYLNKQIFSDNNFILIK